MFGLMVEDFVLQILSTQKNIRLHEKLGADNNKHSKSELAPRPGFGPGSCGRQPHILDRTILPGHKRRNNTR